MAKRAVLVGMLLAGAACGAHASGAMPVLLAPAVSGQEGHSLKVFDRDLAARIHLGMPYAEVAALAGNQGKVVAWNIGNTRYHWSGAAHTELTVDVRDGLACHVIVFNPAGADVVESDIGNGLPIP
jgi:hypothetical protein